MKFSFFKPVFNQQGSTLLETILTSIILGITIMGSLFAYQRSSINAVENDYYTIATLVANEKIEQIMADNTYKGFDYTLNKDYNSMVDNNFNMKCKISLTEVNDNDLTNSEVNSGVAKVDIVISWGDCDTQKVSLSTLITDYK